MTADDSHVIAETLRTDLAKFYPWHPGSQGLQQMRVRLSQGEFWTKECNRVGNRLTRRLVPLLSCCIGRLSKLADADSLSLSTVLSETF